jgi:hypothetical protein
MYLMGEFFTLEVVGVAALAACKILLQWQLWIGLLGLGHFQWEALWQSWHARHFVIAASLSPLHVSSNLNPMEHRQSIAKIIAFAVPIKIYASLPHEAIRHLHSCFQAKSPSTKY